MASPRENVLEDCLDFIGRRVVFSDGLMRLQYFQQFEELYCQENSLSSTTYGRLYNLAEITEFLVILTQAAKPKDEEPYAIDVPAEKSLIPKTEPFDKWRATDWKCFRESLVKIQTSMLRSDATASIDEILGGDCESKEIYPLRENDIWLKSRFFKILELCKFHEKLAPFREELETRSSVANGDEPLSLPRKLFIDFLDMVDDEDQKRSKKAFNCLLKKDQPDTLESAATIRKLLDDPDQQFSFAFVLNKCNQLLRAWASYVLNEEVTADTDLPTSKEVPKARRARALKRLQRARARLNEDVEDPLAAVVVAAAGAVRHRKRKQAVDSNDESDEEKVTPAKSPKKQGTMLEKKKSATRLNFTPEKDSDSENIEDPKEDEDVLSSVSKRVKMASPSPGKKRRSQQKMYEGRRNWSDEEIGAVIQGIAKFGVGKWAVIKREYCLVLKYRTSGQIKDCFRTLKKRGELGDLVLESPKKQSPPKEKEVEEENTGEQKEEEKDEKEDAEEENTGEQKEEEKDEKEDAEEEMKDLEEPKEV